MSAAAASGRTTGGGSLVEYHETTRRVSVSLLYVAPLLAGHELALRIVDPSVRNAAELSVKRVLWSLGPSAAYLHALVGLVMVASLVVVVRERLPALKMAVPFLIETVLWGLLLGPVVSAAVGSLPLRAAPPAAAAGGDPEFVVAVLASIGAGLYEELLFRLVALGGLFVVLRRGFRVGAAPAVVIATLVSAAGFAAYHHVGPFGEPWEARALLFRGAAGILLGALFAFRGLGVVVYLHAWYDILCDVRAQLGG